MAVAEMRMSSILPTINCANCGEEIQISLMGDHVCSTTKQHNGNIWLYQLVVRIKDADRFAEIRQTTLSPKSSQHPFARPTRKAAPQTQRNVSEPITRTTRAPPPRIDPLAASMWKRTQDCTSNCLTIHRPPVCTKRVSGCRSPRHQDERLTSFSRERQWLW